MRSVIIKRKPEAEYRSLGICLMAEENPGKPQQRLHMKSVQPMTTIRSISANEIGMIAMIIIWKEQKGKGWGEKRLWRHFSVLLFRRRSLYPCDHRWGKARQLCFCSYILFKKFLHYRVLFVISYYHKIKVKNKKSSALSFLRRRSIHCTNHRSINALTCFCVPIYYLIKKSNKNFLRYWVFSVFPFNREC